MKDTKKKKKQKPQEALQENGTEDPSVSFSKEKLVSSDLEETAGTGSLPCPLGLDKITNLSLM